MSYLGATQLKASDIRNAGPTTASGGETYVDAAWNAPNIQSLLLIINGVKQATNAYTIGGTPTRLTFVGFTLTAGDVWEIIGINDIGTTVTPGDGTVNLAKMDAGTATSGYFLKADGSSLSWSEVASDPEITTEGKYFENYASITSDLTTAVSSRNKGLIGPITVTADWTVAGDITIF